MINSKGVPCFHAIALCKKCKRPITKDDFYNFCHQESLNNMFTSSVRNDDNIDYFHTIIPCDFDIVKRFNDDPRRCTIRPTLIDDSVAEYVLPDASTSKRIASAGDVKKGGKVKSISRKFNCPRCGKLISKKTTSHNILVCNRVNKRNKKISLIPVSILV